MTNTTSSYVFKTGTSVAIALSMIVTSINSAKADGMGQPLYPNSQHLLITADCGGSNGYRTRLWKLKLQELATSIGKIIHVCHFPLPHE